MSFARTVVSLCVVATAACTRAPDPSPAVARVNSAIRAANPAAERERKPGAGAQIELVVAPTQSDSTTVTVRVTATRALQGAKLRVGTELPTRVEGEAEWDLAAMPEGATLTRTITVRRNQPSQYGSLLIATVSIDQANSRVSDTQGAWVFGEPDPYRVLPRTSLSLSDEGTGSLGPNDRVVRTPEGARIHESIVQ